MKKIILILLLPLLLLPASCRKIPQPVSKADFYLGTYVTVTLYDGSPEELIDLAFLEIKRLEGLLSRNMASSDISRINAMAGIAPVDVSSETIDVIRAGIGYHLTSQGTFDITIGPLVSLWDIGGAGESIPPSADITRAMALMDIGGIDIGDGWVYLSEKGMELDLGGIAKGYIADRVLVFLRENGCSSAIINLGGNVLTLGKKPGGDQWRIGIQDPFSPRGEYFAVLHVNEKSVVTSGIYERYFVQDDKLYHHILDPFTGFPVASDLKGVSIVSNLSMDGDALSTAVFALGLEKGMALVESLSDTEAVFFTDTDKVLYSSGIGQDIKIEFMNAKK
ncbi:MAG: FAD:protein FMN transferase [Clostridia bacterium]